MKHFDSEIYRIVHNGKSIHCTLAFVNMNDLPISRKEAKEQGKKLWAHTVSGIQGDYFILHDSFEKRKVWVYGSHLWFDTKEERDEYRKQATKEYEEFLAWNKVKKAIIEKLDGKSKEELEQILRTLEG